MALRRFGFLVTGAGLDDHRVELATDRFHMTVIGVRDVDQACALARALVDDGVQLLELCGGFGPLGTARVLQAIDGAVPVGAVGYGPESIDALAALFG